MASPVKPQDIEPLLVSDGDSWCVILKKLLKVFYYIFLFYRYAVDENTKGIRKGAANTWGEDICAMNCSDVSSTTPTP